MKIGYIYLYGEEWEDWKKHNKSIAEIIDELKELQCDKIYMDVFIKDDIFPAIERIDMLGLLESVKNSTDTNIFELYLRGKVDKKINGKEIDVLVKKESARILNRRKVKQT